MRYFAPMIFGAERSLVYPPCHRKVRSPPDGVHPDVTVRVTLSVAFRSFGPSRGPPMGGPRRAPARQPSRSARRTFSSMEGKVLSHENRTSLRLPTLKITLSSSAGAAARRESECRGAGVNGRDGWVTDCEAQQAPSGRLRAVGACEILRFRRRRPDGADLGTGRGRSCSSIMLRAVDTI